MSFLEISVNPAAGFQLHHKKSNLNFTAEFQNGKIQNPDKFACTRIADEKSKRKFIVVADSATVYTSPIQENFGTTLTDSYIAIRNKTKNKIRLIKVEEASLKSTHYDTLEEYRRPQVLDKNVALRDFGGKNANRYLDRIKRTQPNVNVSLISINFCRFLI